MGSVRQFIHLKEKASSLVEVTVAMVIFVMVFGTALLVFARVTTSGNSSKHMKYDLLASGHAAAAIEGELYIDTDMALPDGALLQRLVTPYGSSNNLLQMEVFITGVNGDTLGTHKQLIYVAKKN